MDEELDRIESFRAFIKAAEEGAPIPPVSEDDLKRLHELCVDMTSRYSGKDGALSLNSMARACNPGANLPAVWLRHQQIRLLVKEGVLAEWEHGTDLDDAVYQVAAIIPMYGVLIDKEMFIQRLRHEAAP